MARGKDTRWFSNRKKHKKQCGECGVSFQAIWKSKNLCDACQLKETAKQAIRQKRAKRLLVCLCGELIYKPHKECAKCRNQHVKRCPTCKKTFVTARKSSVYCSSTCSGVAKRVANQEAVFCTHCGSAAIIHGDRLRKAKQSGRYFCDIECANEYKQWHNLSDEYQAKLPETLGPNPCADIRKEFVRWALHQGWRCCLDCGISMQSRAKRCEKCAKEVARAKQSKEYQAQCVTKVAECRHCGEEFSFSQHRDATRLRAFCSESCSAKFHKTKRDHWKRSNGKPDADLTLARLVRKTGATCAECGVECIEADGSNHPDEATLDHIHPLSKGGSHTWDNAQVLCRHCNTNKGDKLIGGGNKVAQTA